MLRRATVLAFILIPIVASAQQDSKPITRELRQQQLQDPGAMAEVRRAISAQTEQVCMGSNKDRKDKAGTISFCKCFARVVADEASEQDVVAMIYKDFERAIAFEKRAGDIARERCVF